MLEIKEPDFSTLRRVLLDKLANGQQTVGQLQQHVLHETCLSLPTRLAARACFKKGCGCSARC
jgi:hypothetical protein